MRIGIDYTAAAWQGAGIGRYVRELVGALAPLAGDHRLVLFYAARGLPPASPYLAELRTLCARYPYVVARPVPLAPRVASILWHRLRLPLRIEHWTGPLDLLHAPDYLAPPCDAATIITIHDLSFLVCPESAEPRLRRFLSAAVPRQVRRAALVIAVSRSTHRDLELVLHTPPERIQTIHSGVGRQFHPLPPGEAAAVGTRLGLPREYLLHVGTLEPRKNLVRLMEALALVPEAPDLVLAGRRGWQYAPILAAAERLGSRVRIVDFVADSDLPAVYNAARALIYPSLYEGFGFPPLEALACGTPVVASHSSSLPEILGSAALLVNPEDIAGIAAGIRQALRPETSAWLRAEGPRQAARFTWEATASAVLAAYDRLARRTYRHQGKGANPHEPAE